MRVPRGLDRDSFAIVEGWPYVQGLILDAFTTRLGTRVLRRGYGGDAPSFVDAPGNSTNILRLVARMAACVDQIRDLETGEAIVRLTRGIRVEASRSGDFGLQLAFATLWDDGEAVLDLERLA